MRKCSDERDNAENPRPGSVWDREAGVLFGAQRMGKSAGSKQKDGYINRDR